MNENLKIMYKKSEAAFNKLIAAEVERVGFKAWAKANPCEFEVLKAAADLIDSAFEYMNEQDQRIERIMESLDSINHKLDGMIDGN